MKMPRFWTDGIGGDAGCGDHRQDASGSSGEGRSDREARTGFEGAGNRDTEGGAGDATAHGYARESRPMRRLGSWVDGVERVLKAARGGSAAPVHAADVREPWGARPRGRSGRGARLGQGMAAPAVVAVGGLRDAARRSRRDLPVRAGPRVRASGVCDDPGDDCARGRSRGRRHRGNGANRAGGRGRVPIKIEGMGLRIQGIAPSGLMGTSGSHSPMLGVESGRSRRWRVCRKGLYPAVREVLERPLETEGDRLEMFGRWIWVSTGCAIEIRCRWLRRPGLLGLESPEEFLAAAALAVGAGERFRRAACGAAGPALLAVLRIASAARRERAA